MREIYEFIRDTEAEIQRRLGQLKLTVELVPESCWFSNVRTSATKGQWDALRKATYERYGNLCASCRGRGSKWPVECHEVWEYSILPKGNTQRLLYLVALCPSCHEVKHFGRAQMVGREDAAMHHLASVNGWNHKKTLWYLEQVAEIWNARSEIPEWTLDLSWLEKRFGIVLDTEPPSSEFDSTVEYAPAYGMPIDVIRITYK